MKKVKKLKVLELDKEVIKKLEEAPMNNMLISRNNFKYAFKNDLT